MKFAEGDKVVKDSIEIVTKSVVKYMIKSGYIHIFLLRGVLQFVIKLIFCEQRYLIFQTWCTNNGFFVYICRYINQKTLP